MDQRNFVDSIFEVAPTLNFNVGVNRNGERQINCGKKNLTDDDIRWLYQDICRQGGQYPRSDFERVQLGRPCAVAPFFQIAKAAGLCTESKVGSAKLFEFKFSEVKKRLQEK